MIRGRNAFVEVARGFQDFETAMTRKLYRELSDIMLGALPDTTPPPGQRYAQVSRYSGSDPSSSVRPGAGPR